MHLKDYYSILELEPSATIAEIKRAYRRLAHQHHPDKNNNDAYATANFAEIKEAYEVLTDPSKKEYYLQQRWYEQSIGKRKKQQIITPVSILTQSLELEKYVSRLDVFRMDKEGLQQYILSLLPDSTIEKLHTFNEPSINTEIILIMLKAMTPLPLSYIPAITRQLEKLAANDPGALSLLNNFKQKHQRKHHREKYSLVAIIILTLILCLIIYFAGR